VASNDLQQPPLTSSGIPFSRVLYNFSLINFSLKCTVGTEDAHGALLLAGRDQLQVGFKFSIAYVLIGVTGHLHTKNEHSRSSGSELMLEQTHKQTESELYI
jgi:hypothetical protein